MNGSFRKAWVYTPADIWEPLAAFLTGVDDAEVSDLFCELFRRAYEGLTTEKQEIDIGSLRSNEPESYREFSALTGGDFESELSIVEFLEATQEVLAQYEVPGFVDCYKRLLRDFLQKYNLRYRLDENSDGEIVLRFLLPGSFTNLYAELQRLNSGNPHLASLLADFEHSFNQFSRTQVEVDLRNCVITASKYAEGLAGLTCGASGSLGDLCKQVKDWPHAAIRESLGRLYGFCSDYPNIRHAGNPKGVLRPLAVRDATALSLLLLSFSGYLSPQLGEHAVPGV